MTKQSISPQPHSSLEVARAISLFFTVRGVLRTKLAKGKKLDPSTWLQIETLKFIADHDKPKMKDVAEHLSITAPSTSSLVRGLVKGGLVASVVDKDDRRTSRLILTQAGKAELKKAIARGIKLLSGLFTSLSETELAAFIRALELLKDAAAER